MKHNAWVVKVSDYSEESNEIAGLFDIELPPCASSKCEGVQLRSAEYQQDGMKWTNIHGVSRTMLVDALWNLDRNKYYTIEFIPAFVEGEI